WSRVLITSSGDTAPSFFSGLNFRPPVCLLCPDSVSSTQRPPPEKSFLGVSLPPPSPPREPVYGVLCSAFWSAARLGLKFQGSVTSTSPILGLCWCIRSAHTGS